jgi:hypothetical protein
MRSAPGHLTSVDSAEVGNRRVFDTPTVALPTAQFFSA